jgi:hypothetical protein
VSASDSHEAVSHRFHRYNAVLARSYIAEEL